MGFSTKLICLSFVVIVFVINNNISALRNEMDSDLESDEAEYNLRRLSKLFLDKRAGACFSTSKPCAYTSDNSKIAPVDKYNTNGCCKGSVCRYNHTIPNDDDAEYYGTAGPFYYHIYSCQSKNKSK
ncbi:hypothetical protein I4U23_026792 [Adineta vaga]|nr:hypothetical protein I4U23_026792 [Adineta vaga]